jgi:trk system potassium uptake protein TrkA
VKHVIYPEKDMGRRVAHLVRGTMQDYIDVGDDFALVKTVANLAVVGRPLGESKIRSQHGVTITAYKPVGQAWQYATADTVIQAGDLILVAGQTAKVEGFCRFR